MSYTPSTPVGAYKIAHITSAGTAVPVGLSVNCTTSGAVSATGSQTVAITGSSLPAGLLVGARLYVVDGGSSEPIVVTAINTTNKTITAVFAFTHLSGVTIITQNKITYLGPIIVNSAGSTPVLTLYDGHPSLPQTQTLGVISTTAPVSLEYAAETAHGLFYTLTGSGDIALHYKDGPQPINNF